MKTTDNMNEFRPSTYGDNVSEPLLARIHELEKELMAVKKQVRMLEREKSSKRQHPADDTGTHSAGFIMKAVI